MNKKIFISVFCLFPYSFVSVMGIPPLHQAARDGKLDDVQCLLSDGADIEERDAASWTPLMHAIDGRHLDVICELIKRNADVNAATNTIGNGILWHNQTPLHLAIREKSESHDLDLKIVNELLKKKDVNPNLQDSLGYTPLCKAVSVKRIDIFTKLLNHRNTNVDAASNVIAGVSTVLDYVIIFAECEYVSKLLDAGATCNVQKIQAIGPHEMIPFMIKFLREKKARRLAFLMAGHPRLGSSCLAQVLPHELFEHICRLV